MLGPAPGLAKTPSAHQERRMPGEPGIWMFIFGDMLMFSLLFLTYLWYRSEDVAGFQAAQKQLNQLLGMFNTFFMLSSSWFVASAVKMARRQNVKATVAGFAMGFACGLGFAVVKYFEYGEKIRAGISLTTHDFFMYYYLYTGLHFMHVLIGMGVLAYMGRYALSGGFDAVKIRNLESGASFWHVVDLLWIVLFALLYLLT
jgi:nitric oxide reductase NorE protein